jgi:Ca2+-transporting ATPase
VPFLADIFNIVPLSLEEWQLVLLWSLPVILLDEVLKLFARIFMTNDVKPKRD